jgi:hypothetical protein
LSSPAVATPSTTTGTLLLPPIAPLKDPAPATHETQSAFKKRKTDKEPENPTSKTTLHPEPVTPAPAPATHETKSAFKKRKTDKEPENPTSKTTLHPEPVTPAPVPLEANVVIGPTEQQRTHKPCATPADHIVYREGPYTKELDGRYSHINGVECVACCREVVGTRNTGLDTLGLTVFPTKDNPVWVCSTCQKMLLCNTCFVEKREAFNKENPGKLKRVRRRPASKT